MLQNCVFGQKMNAPNSYQNFDNKKAFNKLINRINTIYRRAEKKLIKQNNNWIKKLQKQEIRLKRELLKVDSIDTEKFFGDISKKYKEIDSNSTLIVKYSKNTFEKYIPIQDSLQIAIQFIKKNDSCSSVTVNDSSMYEQFSKQIKLLNKNYCKSEEMKKMITQRANSILEKYPTTNLKELNKYLKGVNEYSRLIRDNKYFLVEQNKLEKRLMGALRDMPQFKELFLDKSQYSTILGIPQVGNNIAQGVNQVQTRIAIQTSIQTILPSNITNPQQFIQSQIQSQQLQNLRSEAENVVRKLNVSDAESSEINQSNNIKKSKFGNNIEYGWNIQTQKQNTYFPAVSDLALTVGYKLSPKSTLGVGSSYKLGWGKSIENMNLSSQGFGFRTFLDLKLLKQWWLYGGYEKHYENSLTDLGVNNWQASGLIGLNRKIKLKNKTLNTQLLYDFLYKSQQPHRQPIVFRFGYSLTKK